MLTNVLSRRDWSARQIGWAANIAACATVIVVVLIVVPLMVFEFAPMNEWAVVRKLTLVGILCLVPLAQLEASTLGCNSPLRIEDGRIKGWLYGEIGDDAIDVSIREWVWFWYMSPLRFNVIAVFFVGICFATIVQSR